MDPERKAAVSKKMSESATKRWKSMTDEEYKNMCEAMSKGDVKYWSNLLDEEYEARCKVNQMIQDNLSDEKKKIRSEKISKAQAERWKNMSDDMYDYMCEKLSEAAHLYWDNITDEELNKRKEDMSIRSKSFWKNMTKKEFEEWCIKQMKRRKENFTKNELDFMKILNLYNINYEARVCSTIIHPDFYKLFPRNPIMDNEHVVPYHEWDFKLNLIDKSIFIDVDGSIHDPQKTNYQVEYYTGKMFKKSDYIQFNDSQRPYQTDGLDSYIILVYDDNLTMDCIVKNVSNDDTMKLSEFISLIYANNLTDKELKEIIKVSNNS
jgi:hypothetical protein